MMPVDQNSWMPASCSVPTTDSIHQTPENKQKSASTEVKALALLADSASAR